MKATLILLKKLYAANGKALYVHLLLMLFMSSMEGIGIFLIIPLLSIIGAFDMDLEAVPLVSSGMSALENAGLALNLPLVLGLYIFLVGGQALLQRYSTVLSENILQKYVKRLRIETHRSLMRAKWEFFLKRRNSDFNQLLSTEMNRVINGMDTLLALTASVAFTVIQIVFAMWLSFELTAVIIASGLLLSLLSRKFIRKSAELGYESSQLYKSYFAGLNDHFNGMKDIKSNSLEAAHMHWFAALCGKIESNYIQAYRLYANSSLLYRLSSVALIAAFVYLALTVLKVPAEQLLLIVLIFTRLWPRFLGIQSSLESIVSKLAAFEALTGLQEESEAARETREDKQERWDAPVASVSAFAPFALRQGIACQNVTYCYDKERKVSALKQINAFIPANEMTAIVGKSGAGKSTLVDLLMGLIQPDEGTVLADGEPLTGERLNAVRNAIGYVAQEPFLFHGSVRENLKLVVPDATEEEMWEALAFSASDAFVRRMPDGLDTIIGDRGIRLSGGERQRIVLARAMLRKPSILVLDEATSALDGENELIIQQALEELKGKITMIVIAHRLSTIRNADHVLVMENGTLIQQGGYQQLSADARGGFHKLLQLQLHSGA
ncbi:ABC transporter ATP-binding protein [Paenibacillus sp. NEAU-GSW1]|uniref:ABC transporter ATP-binding protein n=1 Tax=Paenibacillus sp. NEAU-GSW1 TaxID=2682486 RepID=UPI0012E1AF21|nr:ABC transporter ATP-binding protein [Paenibacillus sp. NEAU-GSW1]MUT68061.1 ATP-binding cassette domain-containing protein [Paenibacillus sp. NEAU-GSW1]